MILRSAQVEPSPQPVHTLQKEVAAVIEAALSFSYQILLTYYLSPLETSVIITSIPPHTKTNYHSYE